MVLWYHQTVVHRWLHDWREHCRFLTFVAAYLVRMEPFTPLLQQLGGGSPKKNYVQYTTGY